MTLLITKSVVANKLQVAIGYSDKEFETFINEAQEFDFKKLVCEDFYFDLLEKRNESAYQKLIDGGSYEFNGRTYRFQGIASVLSYFAYARFFLNAPMVSTSHGMVIKTTPNSEPVSLEDRRNVYYKKREEANTLMVDVVKFIERKISDYPSWNNGNTSCGGKSCVSGFKTKVIQ